jgi:hypothetical protein
MLDNDPQIRKDLVSIGVPSMASLLGELMVYGDSLRQALSQLPALSGRPADFASTDLHPYLEYQTPKGNVLPYDTVASNLNFLRGLRPALLPPDLRVLNLASENERNLLLGYVSEQRGDYSAAVDYFQHAEGPAKARAELEIVQIQSRHHQKAD